MPVPLNVCGCQQMPVPFKYVDVTVDAGPFKMHVDVSKCQFLSNVWMLQWMPVPSKCVWMTMDAISLKCECHSGLSPFIKCVDVSG